MTKDQLKLNSLLYIICVIALILLIRLFYVILDDPKNFGIDIVKVEGNFLHVSREEIAKTLNHYLLKQSFFTLDIKNLQKDLENYNWIDKAKIRRIWPNTLKITVFEKEPFVLWNNKFMTKQAKIFAITENLAQINIAKLYSSKNDANEILTVYKKLSIILEKYGLRISILQKKENKSWLLVLNNKIRLYLGRKDIENRLIRFCKAYPIVFSNQEKQAYSVDMRYSKGMAVNWQTQRDENG